MLDHIPDKNKKIKIFDIKAINLAGKKDLTFFNSLSYKDLASKTKAAACITTENLQVFLPKNV